MENTNQTFALDTNADFMLNAFMHAVNQHIDKRVEKLLAARLNETATNAQIMATLDTDFEYKVRSIAQAVVQTHLEDADHPDNDDIRSIVDDMDLTNNLTAKIEEIVGETDMSSNMESAIETYLEENHYAKEEYVDDKMEGLTEDDGFTTAVKDVVKDMNFEVTVARY